MTTSKAFFWFLSRILFLYYTIITKLFCYLLLEIIEESLF